MTYNLSQKHHKYRNVQLSCHSHHRNHQFGMYQQDISSNRHHRKKPGDCQPLSDKSCILWAHGGIPDTLDRISSRSLSTHSGRSPKDMSTHMCYLRDCNTVLQCRWSLNSLPLSTLANNCIFHAYKCRFDYTSSCITCVSLHSSRQNWDIKGNRPKHWWSSCCLLRSSDNLLCMSRWWT